MGVVELRVARCVLRVRVASCDWGVGDDAFDITDASTMQDAKSCHESCVALWLEHLRTGVR